MPHIKNTKDLHTFVLKYSIISSVTTLVMAHMYNEYIDKFVVYLISPIFSFDLNNDGKPDLEQIKQFSLTLGKTKIPLGLILFNLAILIIKIVILYYILKLLISKLDL